MMRRLLLCGGLLLLQACATPLASKAPAPSTPSLASYQGRISVRVAPPQAQSLNADFLISGSATAGTLQLSGPLGTTLAHLQWAPGFAQLRQQGRTETYPDLPSMLDQLTGSRLPTEVVFSWLEGKGLVGLAASGWVVLEEGDAQAQAETRRLKLLRPAPAPVVRLTLLLDETP